MFVANSLNISSQTIENASALPKHTCKCFTFTIYMQSNLCRGNTQCAPASRVNQQQHIKKSGNHNKLEVEKKKIKPEKSNIHTQTHEHEYHSYEHSIFSTNLSTFAMSHGLTKENIFIQRFGKKKQHISHQWSERDRKWMSKWSKKIKNQEDNWALC